MISDDFGQLVQYSILYLLYSGVHKITRGLFRVLKYSANNFSHTIVSNYVIVINGKY